MLRNLCNVLEGSSRYLISLLPIDAAPVMKLASHVQGGEPGDQHKTSSSPPVSGSGDVSIPVPPQHDSQVRTKAGGF